MSAHAAEFSAPPADEPLRHGLASALIAAAEVHPQRTLLRDSGDRPPGVGVPRSIGPMRRPRRSSGGWRGIAAWRLAPGSRIGLCFAGARKPPSPISPSRRRAISPARSRRSGTRMPSPAPSNRRGSSPCSPRAARAAAPGRGTYPYGPAPFQPALHRRLRAGIAGRRDQPRRHGARARIVVPHRGLGLITFAGPTRAARDA